MTSRTRKPFNRLTFWIIVSLVIVLIWQIHSQRLESYLANTSIPSAPIPEVATVSKLMPPIDGIGAKPNLEALEQLPPAISKAGKGAPFYNHLPYEEAQPQELVVVGNYGRRTEQLQKDAAASFKQMQSAAAQSNVKLIPISGFRSISIQKELFSAQIEKRGSESKAATASAPPGHSEHHTGYVLDMGDGDTPNADVNQSFAQTNAFRWLRQNAQQYGWEISFPFGNKQGVMYEPWHWRFVGSPEAKATFDRARKLYPSA